MSLSRTFIQILLSLWWWDYSLMGLVSPQGLEVKGGKKENPLLLDAWLFPKPLKCMFFFKYVFKNTQNLFVEMCLCIFFNSLVLQCRTNTAKNTASQHKPICGCCVGENLSQFLMTVVFHLEFGSRGTFLCMFFFNWCI